jgi:hypothetical protein
MPSNRPYSVADLFVGGGKLRDLFEVVGMVVTNFGGIEDTLRYLEWQLHAFALAAAMPPGTPDNDLQILLATPRSAYYAKHRSVSKILRGIEDGLANSDVATALGSNATAFGVEWRALKIKAKDLGDRRNALAHSAIGLSGVSIVRSMGLLAQAQSVNPLDDAKLAADIGAFHAALGVFINKLTRTLPFRDHNIAVFSEAAVV